MRRGNRGRRAVDVLDDGWEEGGVGVAVVVVRR